MKKIFFPRNENGMSLVSVMVASVLGIILFMGITSGIQSMYVAQKNVDMSSTAMSVSDQMRIRFDSPQACNDSMTGQAYTPMGSNSISGITVSVNGVSTTLTNGAEVAPGLGWSVVSVDLETSNSDAQAQDVILNDTATTTVTYKKYAGTIKIQFRRTDGSAQTPAPVYVPVVFLGDSATHIIQSCGQTAMGQVMCKSMGYVWRDDLVPAVCQKANECVYGGSYVESSIPASQGGFDNPLTGARSCIDASYTPVRSGTVTFANKNGKYGFQSIVGEVYDCTRCVDANGAVTTPSAPTPLSFSPGWNADPAATAAETRDSSIDGTLGGPCTMTMPAFPPYWMAPVVYNVPCMHTTTTTTTSTTLPPNCPAVAAGAYTFGTAPYTLCVNDSAIPVTANGVPVTLNDTVGPLVGSYTVTCSGGTWPPLTMSGGCSLGTTTTTTTTTTLPGSCPAVAAGAYLFGTAPYILCANDSAIPITPNGGSVTLSDTMSPKTGSFTVTCTGGTWPSLIMAGGCVP